MTVREIMVDDWTYRRLRALQERCEREAARQAGGLNGGSVAIRATYRERIALLDLVQRLETAEEVQP